MTSSRSAPEFQSKPVRRFCDDIHIGVRSYSVYTALRHPGDVSDLRYTGVGSLYTEVIDRARRLLAELESSHEGDGRPITRRPDPAQLTLFSPPPHPAVERLRRVDPNHLTPIQALALLADVVALAQD